MNLIKKAMAASGGSKFLIDGFPRNQNNLDGWFTTMGDSVRDGAACGVAAPAGVRGFCVREPCPAHVNISRGSLSFTHHALPAPNTLRRRWRACCSLTAPRP